MALQAYRHLMRAAEIAFKGDFRMLDAARSQIRHGFQEKAALASSEVQPAIQQAEEIATFLKANLVQGRKEGEVYSKHDFFWILSAPVRIYISRNSR
ncbi:hypothetical protein B0T19DRAFT_36987 [Cercophora scortea]|uniref:Mitochondrial zinc maintenance protein 1, mitochondrial n=1 Tax=Cercophora scortea TaxID=314031 RepID=A0AAE0J3U6_9PEZI|nr:hypothetical protein B0T19DRAFT_36987 [Cercophora scortea]